MNWRTDKPTANVIVALVRFVDENMIGYQITEYHFRALEKFADDFYVDYCDTTELISNDRIVKWADLEEDETVTDCDQYSAVEEELDAFIKSGKAIKEENCGTYTTTYIDPLKVARHFAKWGAEHSSQIASQWKPTQKQIDLLQSFVSDSISLGKKAELKSIIGGLKQLKK